MDKDIYIIKKALARYTIAETKAISRMLDRVEPPSQGAYQKLDERVTEIREDNKPHLTFKKAITILIAAILVIVCMSVSVYAISQRTKIGIFFVEWFEGYVKLSTDVSKNENASVEKVEITYIPEGFSVVNEQKGKDLISFEWQKDEDVIYMTVVVIRESDGFLNTESDTYTITNVGNYVVHKNEYTDSIHALWTDDNFIYTLSCTNLPWEEMVKIIEGISYAE